MLVTVTNVSGATINDLDSRSGDIPGPAKLLATGGARLTPLPYPFGHIGALADTASEQLPMHPRDWRHSGTQGRDGFEPSLEWQTLVQRGIVTMATAAETDRTDEEELFMNAV